MDSSSNRTTTIIVPFLLSLLLFSLSQLKMDQTIQSLITSGLLPIQAPLNQAKQHLSQNISLLLSINQLRYQNISLQTQLSQSQKPRYTLYRII